MNLSYLNLSLGKAMQYIRADIWRVRARTLPQPRRFFIRQLRIIILTFRGLTEDRFHLRASALTFFTAISVVPLLAMIFGIAQGFGLDKVLEKVLLERLQSQEEILNWALGFAHVLLENVRGGLMAGVGIVFLFWAIFRVLSHIENAFNDIWGIKRGRPLGRKITDYLAIMLICPFFFILSGTVTVFITSGVNFVVNKISLFGAVAPLIFFLIRLAPYLVLWVMFSFLYIFMPNTKVDLRAGVTAGVIAATLYQVFQAGYIGLQVGVSRYNAIYGSFAAVPLFFIWLQISWSIVLFGAEVSCASQNVDTYEFEADRRSMSHQVRRLLSLRIMRLLVHRFADGNGAAVREMAQALEIPTPLIQDLIYDMIISGLISEVQKNEDDPPIYQPAVDPEKLTIHYVVGALEKRGEADLPFYLLGEPDEIYKSLAEMEECLAESSANRRLKDI